MNNLIAVIQNVYCMTEEKTTRLQTNDLKEAKRLVDKVTGKTLNAKIFQEIGFLGEQIMFNIEKPLAVKTKGCWHELD